MVNRSCTTCVYAWWEPGQWLVSVSMGYPSRPACANHPDSPGRMKTVPFGGPCRNYRAKPATPEGDVRRIPLGDGLYAYVDAADYEWLSKYQWRLCGSGYAGRRAKGRTILMHREIMQPPKGMVVDHISGNPLNNCRINMRNCKRGENVCNQAKHGGCTSRFKGVYFFKRTGKWAARLQYKHVPMWLGYFDNEIEAARAYDLKAVQVFGDFARLNFPEEWPPERRAEVRAQWLKENGMRVGKRRKTRGGSVKRHTRAPAPKARKRPTHKAKQAAGRSRRKTPGS